MKVLGKKYVRDFIIRYPDCKKAAESLVLEIESASWKTPHDVKARYPKASIIGKLNIVFNSIILKITKQLTIDTNNIIIENKIKAILSKIFICIITPISKIKARLY